MEVDEVTARDVRDVKHSVTEIMSAAEMCVFRNLADDADRCIGVAIEVLNGLSERICLQRFAEEDERNDKRSETDRQS